MAELGLAPNDIGALQKMEWARLNAAANAVIEKVNGPRQPSLGMGAPSGSTPRIGMGPTMDGRIIPVRSFYEGAPEISKNVPMLIGSVSEEGNRMSSDPTEAKWHATLAEVIGDAKATALIAAMKKAHPEKSIRTLSYGVSGLLVRNNITRMAKMKYDLRPRRSLLLLHLAIADVGRRGRVAHRRIGLLFRQRETLRTGDRQHAGGAEAGKENGHGLGQFRPHGQSQPARFDLDALQSGSVPTMVFDNKCRMVDDPEGEVRKLLIS